MISDWTNVLFQNLNQIRFCYEWTLWVFVVQMYITGHMELLVTLL